MGMNKKGSLTAKLDVFDQRFPEFWAQEARNFSSDLVREVRALTPVGVKVDKKTGVPVGPSGDLKKSIRPVPARGSKWSWTVGVWSAKDYARHVEYGTKAHIIQAQAGHYLRFWASGSVQFAKRVKHPGTQGHFMFLRGSRIAETQWKGSSRARLNQFMRQFK